MKIHHLAIAVMVLFYLLRGFWLLYVIPPWQGPDEPMHLLLAVSPPKGPMSEPDRISLEGTIIRSMAKRGFWELTGQVEPDPLPELIRRYRPTPAATSYHKLLGVWLRGTRVWKGWDSENEDIAYVERLLRVSRIPTVLLSTGALLCLALFSARVVPGSWFGLLPPLLFIAHPQMGFIGSCVNSDSMLTFISALGLLLFVLSMRPKSPLFIRIGLILVCLVAPVVKRAGLAVTIPLLTAALWAWSGPRRKTGWIVAALAILGGVVVAGLWVTGMGRGMIMDVGEVLGLVGYIPDLPHGWWQTWISHLWGTFIANFGWVQCPLGAFWYKVLALAAVPLFLMVPSGMAALRRAGAVQGSLLFPLVAQVVIAVVQVVVVMGARGELGQGRHLFVALPAFIFLVALGIRGVAPSRSLPWLWPAIGVLVVLLGEVSLWFVMLPCFLR
jgi:hypothetical protein